MMARGIAFAVLSPCLPRRLQGGPASRRPAAGAAGPVGQGGGPHDRDARPVRRHHPAALQDRFRLPIFGRMVARVRRCRRDRAQKGDELAALDPAVQAILVRNAEAVGRQRRGAARQRRGRGGPPAPLVERNITPQAAVRPDRAEPRDRRRQPDARPGLAAPGPGRSSPSPSSVPISTASSPAAMPMPGQVVNAGQKIVTVARPEVREAVIAVPTDARRHAVAGRNDFDDAGRARPDDRR